MATDWIEVTVTSDIDAGELLGALDDPAITGAWQKSGVMHLYWPSAKWSPESLDRLRQVLERFQPGTETQIGIDHLPERDWNREWSRQVKPLRIGRQVVVRPSWESVVLAAGDIELIIDPKQAFGTGHHATTQLMIELLEEVIGGGERVLDVGTGSGILAMVALRLGASTAAGIDTDPVAIDCAVEYAAVNGFGPELRLLPISLQSLQREQGEPFNLVLANLDRGTIRELGPMLLGYLAAGARLLVSGILLEQRDDVAAQFAAAGVGMRRHCERDGWVAVEFVMSESCEA